MTILCQANGSATLMIENLLARAADTSDDTWIDRFTSTTYADLIEDTGLMPTDAETELARLYNDDAKKLMALWNDFYAVLSSYDSTVKLLKDFDSEAAAKKSAQLKQFITDFDSEKDSYEQLNKAIEELKEQTALIMNAANAAKKIAVYDSLSLIEYSGGEKQDGETLLDFFKRSSGDVERTELYPIAAALSDGQKAGLDFISLFEMVTIALTDGEQYSDYGLDELEEISIYKGVNREIYEKSSVALTSEALRLEALEQIGYERQMLSNFSISMILLSGISIYASIHTYVYYKRVGALDSTINSSIVDDAYDDIVGSASEISKASDVSNKLLQTDEAMKTGLDNLAPVSKKVNEVVERRLSAISKISADDLLEEEHNLDGIDKLFDDVVDVDADNSLELCDNDAVVDSFSEASEIIRNRDLVPLGIALFSTAWTVATLLVTYYELVDYYDVEFTPIPRYMVDEKDITAYNAKGEKIFIKNQRAYYKAAECNRTEYDERFGTLGVRADLNGDVGSQWLALYFVKQEPAAPILAESLKAVVGKDDLPAGYTTGIHMFGSSSAFDMNNHMFVWNGDAPPVYVYYKTDDAGRHFAAGSLFAGGQLAFAAGAGVAVGIIAAVIFTVSRKKKKEEGTTAA